MKKMLFAGLCGVLLDARCYEIGRYGRLHLAFLREKHPDVYATLIFTGELGPRLVEFDAACRCSNETKNRIRRDTIDGKREETDAGEAPA